LLCGSYCYKLLSLVTLSCSHVIRFLKKES
jgi:hypothetical protein